MASSVQGLHLPSAAILCPQTGAGARCGPCALPAKGQGLRSDSAARAQLELCRGPAAAAPRARLAVTRAAGEEAPAPSGRIITGPCFVLEDNIDTDQIIPAEYLTLVPSNPDEYEKLGSYALAGLPAAHTLRYVAEGEMKTQYPIIIGGANFGCGSSREHAPVALGAAGCKAVVAESYARIFFRNCVATGELYPVEVSSEASGERLCEAIKSGDIVTVDLEHDLLIHEASGKQYPLAPIGEAGPVIDAGGIFNFARQSGMIASAGK